MPYKKYEFLQSLVIIVSWFLGMFFFVYSGENYSLFGEMMPENLTINILYFFFFCLIVFFFKNNFKINNYLVVLFILLIISLISFMVKTETEFFWPFVLPLCLIGINLSKHKILLKKIFLFSIILHYLYIFQIFLVSTGVIDPILINQRLLDYYFTGNEFRLSMQYFYIHSNSAGAILFAFYILINSIFDSKTLVLKLFLIPLILFSGSLASVLCVVLYEFFLRFSLKINAFKLFIFTCFGFFGIILLFQYLLAVNEIGFIARFEVIYNFFLYFFTNPYIILLPNFLINGVYYTESSFLDLFMNFGFLSFFLFYFIYKCKETRIYLLILLITSASLTPMSSLILYIIYNISKNED